jgi:glycerophosphoryl diester phosphodiesterase
VRRRPRSRRDAGAGTYFSPAPPRVLAHRGLAIDAPENTLLAFLRALSIGVTHIETDVHASVDGVAVISHDPDLHRVAGRTVRIDQLTISELRRVDLGDGQTFASLSEALDAFPHARFNIDLKSSDVVGPAVEAIREAGALGRVLVTSFSDRRREAAVRLLPGVATSTSAWTSALALLLAQLGIGFLLRRALRGIHAVQIPPARYGLRIVTPRIVRMLHTVPVEVHVWTINDPIEMRRLLDIGVDGLVTDRADLALAVLENRSVLGE